MPNLFMIDKVSQNLQSRFASALADTPLKKWLLHIGITSELLLIN
jgi:hypothetical protein